MGAARTFRITLLLAYYLPFALLAAADTARFPFDIPEGMATESIKTVARQSGVDIVFDPRVTESVTTPSLRGNFTPRQALERLLAGTSLVVIQDEETTAFAVRRESGLDPNSDNQRELVLKPNTNNQTELSMNETTNDSSGASQQDNPASAIERKNFLSRILGSALATFIVASSASAQQEYAEPSVYELSPFEISEGSDLGYVATATLAGSRLNTALLDTPASISVMTQEFLEDIGATDLSEAIEYGLSAGNDIGGGGANVGASTGNGIQFNDFNFQIRGYRNASATRDYFPTTLSADMYNVERVEVARGPNSLIFGVGGPGGIVNVHNKSAILTRDFASLSFRGGSWDEKRGTLDFNKTFADETFALRLNLLHQAANGWKDFERNDQDRAALALTYQPNDFLKVRLQGDGGTLKQNRVRPWGPVDQISVWKAQGSYHFAFGTPESPWLADDNNYTQTRQASGGSPNNGLTPNIPAGQTFERRSANASSPTLYMMDGPLEGKWIWTGNRNEGTRYYRTSFSDNLPGYNSAAFIDDESILPRSANLMGPGALNTTDYETLTGIVDLRITDDFNINVTAARTDIDRRQNNITGFASIAYRLDVTTMLPTFTSDGLFNATEGGPSTGQGTGALNFVQMVPNDLVDVPIFNYSPTYTLINETQDDIRISASYHLDLGAIGDHTLLGFAQRSETGRDNERYAETNISPNRPNTNTWFNGNNYTGRTVHIDPWSSNLEDRGAPDPWIYPMPDSILWGRGTQYQFQAGWIRNAMGKSETQIDSSAVALQSKFLNGTLITTIGGRRDDVSIRNWGQVRDSLGEVTGISDPTGSQDESGDTYSIGAVYHLPWVDWLSVFGNKSTNFQPQGGAQLFEDADLLPNREIGALKGTGEDYGVKFKFFDGKVYATLAR
ncbi:MAG: TonB-dependent receptor plug domain-containing protein, partial [Verrucomicrobiae bacterium]|nr:TonB-dependent receptor plug domain-containing protein [Verrucomicrobiae bacterium]